MTKDIAPGCASASASEIALWIRQRKLSALEAVDAALAAAATLERVKPWGAHYQRVESRALG